jgi:hypothetical protein
MGNKEESAYDLTPRPELDVVEFCQAGRMPSIPDGLNRNKLDSPYKGAQLPEPHVMHRDPAGKWKRCSQKFPRKSETAAHISIFKYIPPETGFHFEQGKDGIFHNLFDIVHHITVECHKVWSGRRLGESFSDHLHLVVEPDVILIGKHYDISPRLAQGVFKVKGWAEECISGKQANTSIGKRPNDLQRPVSRRIVRDYHLIVRGQLGKDRFHLAPDEALAVVGCHANGDAVGSQWLIERFEFSKDWLGGNILPDFSKNRDLRGNVTTKC